MQKYGDGRVALIGESLSDGEGVRVGGGAGDDGRGERQGVKGRGQPREAVGAR